MKELCAIILLTLSLYACSKDIIGNAGSSLKGKQQMSTKAIYCLRDMLIGEDPNGSWTVIIQPDSADLQPLLIGQNPCLDWSNKPCGLYRLQYIVGDMCCKDTSFVNPLKCCLVGYSVCTTD
jgi:hypothetical protein